MQEVWSSWLYIPDKPIIICWASVVEKDDNADDDSEINGKWSWMSLVRALITAWWKVSIIFKTFI